MQPRPEIDAMKLYAPGTSVEDAEKATGHVRVIKLASNESLWGPSPQAIQSAQKALASVQYYPGMQPPALVAALAKTHQISSQMILVGNGADEILRVIATAYSEPGTSILYPHPSFSAYHHSARLSGADPRPIGLRPSGENDLQAILNAIDGTTRVIYLCAPNNPTGGMISRRDWASFLAEIPKTVLVVVDGAYQEFMEEESAPDFLEAVRQGHPVIVVRTFSKLYALAGLRIGWAVAPPSVITALNKTREPFSLNAIGAQAATASLEDHEYFAWVLQETRNARSHLVEMLTSRGISHFSSQANFVTMKSPEEDERMMANRLLQQGFVVRPTTSFGLPGYLRVTVAPKNILDDFMRAWDQLKGE